MFFNNHFGILERFKLVILTKLCLLFVNPFPQKKDFYHLEA